VPCRLANDDLLENRSLIQKVVSRREITIGAVESSGQKLNPNVEDEIESKASGNRSLPESPSGPCFLEAQGIKIGITFRRFLQLVRRLGAAPDFLGMTSTVYIEA
jgi:hypothetical protein